MNDNFYKHLLEHFFMINLDLLCIADTEGNFIEVNKEWENILGYSKEELKKRKFLDFVHPEDIDATLEVMSRLAEQEQILNFVNRYRCQDGSYRYIEWRSQPHGNLIFAAARDITEKINDRRALESMVNASEYFLQLYDKELDYQKITEDFLDISGAIFTAFNLYSEDGKQYTTMATAGNKEAIKEFARIIKKEGKKRVHDRVRAEKLKGKTITRFPSLMELTGDIISRSEITALVNTFSLGETVVIKILKNNIMLGDFILIMSKGESFDQDNIAEVYTRQLGLVITQKMAEEKLRESEASLKEAQSIARIGRWELIHSTNSLNWTDTIFDIFEINKEEFGASYQAFLNAIHPVDREMVDQAWVKSLENMSPYEITHRLLMKDGRVKWVNEACETVFDEQGRPLKSVGIVQDITERKNSEEELKILKEDYEKVFQGTQDSMFLVQVVDNNTFRYIRNNIAHQKSTGLTIENIRGKTPQELVGEDLGSIIASNYKRCVQCAAPIAYEETLDLATGRRIWYTSLTPVFQQERVAYIVGSSQDITEKKQAEEELTKSRERLANILEGTNVGTWEWNVITGVIVFNKRWAEIIGYTLEELAPITIDTWLKFTHPQDMQKAQHQLKQVFAREIDFYDIELRMRHKDGHWVWVQDRGKVMSWTSDGKPLLMSGTHTDITERKRLETFLANEKKLLETTLISVGDGVISTDNKGNIVFINKVAEFLTGWNTEEAKGKPIEEVFNIINEFTREKAENIVEKVLESRKILELANHTVLISKDGTERPIEDSAAPIVQANGEVLGVVLVFRDFSEKKEKQEEIIYLIYHDQLTGLYNRRFYEEELKRLDTKRNLPMTIVMADVNGLKLINDSFGHALGDELLKKAAEVITQGCRADDIIARLGGDEYVILLPKTDAYEAEKIIKRIKGLALKEKVASFDISISFGFATKEKENENIQEIFKNAEDHMYRKKLYESSSMRNKTIEIIMNTLYEKINREMLHSKRVSEISEAIAINMNFDLDAINQIRTAGLMHDIGKMGIDEKILNKPQRLNNHEWEEIKRHPEIGYRILSSVNEFSEMASYILEHHERWDGKGYPRGLKGEEISLQARIIGVADAFDAMTSERPYCKPLTIEEATAEIRKCSGAQFDPTIARIFVERVLGSVTGTVAFNALNG